jgi:hypothetical protein
MAATCRSCGAALPEGAGRCPSCFAIVKPPGLFQRLLGGLKFNFAVNTSPGRAVKPIVDVKTFVKSSETIQIRDTATGETKVYHSLEEVPEKYRKQMNQAMTVEHIKRSKQVTSTGGHVSRSEQIVFVGPDGVRHTYKSMDEVPESVRKLIDGAEQATDRK